MGRDLWLSNPTAWATQGWPGVVVEDIVQMPLKQWQVWGIGQLSRKPIPGFDHPLVRRGFLMSNLNLLWCIFEAFPCVLSLDAKEKRLAPSPPQEAAESSEVSPSLLQLRQSWSLQPLFPACVFQPCHQLGCPSEPTVHSHCCPGPVLTKWLQLPCLQHRFLS